MNMEILSANVKTDESHTFSFSKPVQQFMVGFSKCNIEYPRPDHHVKQISIDLNDAKQANNEVTVKPQLRLNDNGGHRQSPQSSVTIVVIAIVGDGNPDVQLYSGIKGYFKNDTSIEDPTFVRSALTYTFVQHPSDGHHVMKYSASVNTLSKPGSFILRGQSLICDRHPEHDLEDSKVYGSSIVYGGKDQRVILAEFDSKNIGQSGNACFGDAIQGCNYENYQIGIFISGFEVSFKNKTDHHVLKIELGSELAEPKLFVSEGKVNAKLNLNAYLSDNGDNQYRIPHNSVSGFIIAFNNQ